jgi:hypothetical protein
MAHQPVVAAMTYCRPNTGTGQTRRTTSGAAKATMIATAAVVESRGEAVTYAVESTNAPTATPTSNSQDRGLRVPGCSTGDQMPMSGVSQSSDVRAAQPPRSRSHQHRGIAAEQREARPRRETV